MYLMKCVVFIIIFDYISADSKVITEVSFNISINNNIPTCIINPVRGLVTIQQRFRVSAASKDKEFATNVTKCFFTHNNTRSVRLKPKDENNLFVASDELYFKPEMDGHQLICELGLRVDIQRNANINNNRIDSYDRRSSTATCVMNIHLDNQTGTVGGIENKEIDYKMLMIIGFSLAGVFLLICLTQSVALCICITKGHFRKKNGERTNTDSIISNSGTIYEELKPIPEDIETLTVDESDKDPGKCSTIDPPRREKYGKKGIMAMFARSLKSHPLPVTEPTLNLPDPPCPEKNVKKGIMARFSRSPKSHLPPVTDTTLAGVNPSSARPHVFQEEIYSNEYVPEPTSVENKAPPRPPKPSHQLKPPVAKKLIRQQKFECNSPTPVKSSKRISELVSKLERNLKPPVAQTAPVTSVLKPKGRLVASEQHVPVQHHAWSPPPRTPVVVPTQHHLEDKRMDSEDSEDWTYEDLEEIYEMPEQ